jgi:hypothetical protein
MTGSVHVFTDIVIEFRADDLSRIFQNVLELKIHLFKLGSNFVYFNFRTWDTAVYEVFVARNTNSTDCSACYLSDGRYWSFNSVLFSI